MQITKLYMNEKEASDRYGYRPSWWQRKRWSGGGPQFVKVNGKILYHIEETDKWFESHTKKSTADYSEGNSHE